jgi:carbamoyl-phosphate synthase small subunit
MEKGYLVLESGEVYEGIWRGGKPRAGEVVFNTSHFGYEEMATDPSYFSQILVLTAPMQGNYGAHKEFWESRKIWIDGFICMEMQNSERDGSWLKSLDSFGIPVLTDLDTRSLVLRLRDKGTPWGALVDEANRGRVAELIKEKKSGDKDWVFATSRNKVEIIKGTLSRGPRIAVLDFGAKENILRELAKQSSEVAVFNSRTSAMEIQKWEPNAVFLTNGPGDPGDVRDAVATVKSLLGWRPVYGICMGHQILSHALGLKTYKLKFGHRGGNHPVKDLTTGSIYVTSQNHGYAVDIGSGSQGIVETHVNLNDNSNEGLECKEKKCRSVQFHPESHPGPEDAMTLFNHFFDWIK